MGSLVIYRADYNSRERPKYAKTAKHNLHMAPLRFIVPPEILGSPLNLGPSLIPKLQVPP